jgi:hypothetical protein
MKKPTYFIMYKYANQPWKEFDRTQVQNWAEIQEIRCRYAHPDAQVKIDPRR